MRLLSLFTLPCFQSIRELILSDCKLGSSLSVLFNALGVTSIQVLDVSNNVRPLLSMRSVLETLQYLLPAGKPVLSGYRQLRCSSAFKGATVEHSPKDPAFRPQPSIRRRVRGYRACSGTVRSKNCYVRLMISLFQQPQHNSDSLSSGGYFRGTRKAGQSPGPFILGTDREAPGPQSTPAGHEFAKLPEGSPLTQQRTS